MSIFVLLFIFCIQILKQMTEPQIIAKGKLIELLPELQFIPDSSGIEVHSEVLHLPVKMIFQGKEIASIILITDLTESLVIVDNNG